MLVIKEQYILKEMRYCYIELITIARKKYFIICDRMKSGYLYITPAEPDFIKQYKIACDLLRTAENKIIEGMK